MVELKEINKEIQRLEKADTTYPNCQKLSYLYTVRDHMQVDRQYAPDYSTAAFPQSEFLAATEGIPMEHILSVLDEHMEAIKVLYPKEYRAILKRIRE